MVTDKQRSELVTQLTLCEALKHGTFTLSSGQTSDYYIDIRQAVADPWLLMLIARMMVKLPPPIPLRYAAVALGGISLAVGIAFETHTQFLIVRPESKTHGTGKLIEGRCPGAGTAVLVEDVATTGGSLLKAAATLRKAGMTVESALVVVDREGGAKEALAAQGIQLHALLTASYHLSTH